MSTEERNPNTLDIDLMSTEDALHVINREDRKVASAVEAAIPQIARAVDEISARLARGAQMIYVGAGTSGRLGILDAVELRPTFGIGDQMVQALIAGGYEACHEAQESLEDDPQLGAADLRRRGFEPSDVVVGISAGGKTLYTLGALRFASTRGALTVGITCNPDADLARVADISIVLDTGPEVITGSTRLKAATAQKMALNMISTLVMVRLGRVYSNLMTHLAGDSRKLHKRSVDIVSQAADIPPEEAASLLAGSGGIPAAVLMARLNCSAARAQALLEQHGSLRKALGE